MDKEKTKEILTLLQQSYPDAHCELFYGDTFQLLVAVILSAQCTDKRVNVVTKELFKRASTPQEFAVMPPEELEKLIFSCGFYHNKARSIINASQDIVNKFGGKVPDTFEELLTLAGVGRKTANVMMSVGFHEQAIAVDTHVFRVSHRLGLSNGKTPYEVEKDLRALVEPDNYSLAHHLMIFHGRYCCKSQNPQCGLCKLTDCCEYYRGTEHV